MDKGTRAPIIATALLLALGASPRAADSWKLVWSDEFSGSGLPDPAKWNFQVGGDGFGNNESQYYTDKRTENVRQEDGNLIIESRREPWGNRNYTSGRIHTAGKGDWKYGRVEVRAKLPTGRGTWAAIWLLPTDNVYGGWPKSGELDVMENVGYDPDRVHSNIHCQSFNGMDGTNKGANRLLDAPYQVYHLYRMDWFADRVEYWVDDTLLFTYRNDATGATHWPFDQKFHLILNVALGGNWGGIKGIDDAIFPQRMYVDWVRVYQRVPDAPTTLSTEVVGEGTIATSPRKDTYLPTDSVALEAKPAAGAEFVRWDGDLTGTNPRQNLSMAGDRRVKAWFRPLGEMLFNGNFGGGAEGWSGPTFQGAATGSGGVTSGSMVAKIATAGSQAWAVQTLQEGFSLVQGRSYTLSFRARASHGRSFDVSLEHAVSPWTSHFRTEPDLTPQDNRFRYSFRMDDATDASARVVFNLGLDTGTVVLDSVSLHEGSETSLSPSNRSFSANGIGPGAWEARTLRGAPVARGLGEPPATAREWALHPRLHRGDLVVVTRPGGPDGVHPISQALIIP